VDGRGQAYPITYFPAGSTPATADSVAIGLGEERRGIDIVIRPVPASHIFGVVQGPPDAIAGLVLRLVPAGLEDLGNGSEAATTLVGAEGRFTFLNVPAGAYIIDAPRAPLDMTFDAGQGMVALPQAPGNRLTGSQSGTVVSGAPGTGYIRRSGQVRLRRHDARHDRKDPDGRSSWGHDHSSSRDRDRAAAGARQNPVSHGGARQWIAKPRHAAQRVRG
jgi:hypothetical protein